MSSPMAINVSIYNFCTLTPMVFSNLRPTFSPSLRIASRMCSVPVSWLLNFSASLWLSSRTLAALGEYPSLSISATLLSGAISSLIILMSCTSSTPFSARTLAATPVFSFMSPTRICSLPI